MRKGAANSKRMCIICHYLIAQNGDACTSFFDTLVGSVNNNVRDQVRSVCQIHFSLDHSSDKLISFSTRNSILLLVQLTNYFFPQDQVTSLGCGLYAGKYGIFNNYPAKSRGISPDTQPTRLCDENAKSQQHISLIKIKTELQEIEVYYRSLKKTYLQTHVWK